MYSVHETQKKSISIQNLDYESSVNNIIIFVHTNTAFKTYQIRSFINITFYNKDQNKFVL